MPDTDTIKLLRECDAGIKMGIASIDDVEDYVENVELLRILSDCKWRHLELEREMETLLSRYHDDGKEPNPLAKGMSWIKTNVKLMMEYSDQTIAELMTDGCDMGIKSLTKYLNEYSAANEKAKEIAGRIIRLEEGLRQDIRVYL